MFHPPEELGGWQSQSHNTRKILNCWARGIFLRPCFCVCVYISSRVSKRHIVKAYVQYYYMCACVGLHQTLCREAVCVLYLSYLLYLVCSILPHFTIGPRKYTTRQHQPATESDIFFGPATISANFFSSILFTIHTCILLLLVLHTYNIRVD